MIKTFLKESAIYGVGRIAAVFFSFATLPILTNHLSAAEYGIIDLLVLCVILFNLVVALEVSQAVSRFLGDAESSQERSLYTSTAMFFSIGMYAISGIVVFIFHNEISQILFGEKTSGRFILFFIPWFILHGLNYFITNQLRWENRAIPFVIIKTLNGSLMLLAVIWLIKTKNMGVEGVLYSYIFSLAVTAIIGGGLLIYYTSLRTTFCKIKLKEMLSFSFPLVPSSAAVFVQNYIDRIMVNNLLDLQSLGLYSFAFKIASGVTLVSMAFQMSITPLIYKLHKEKKTPLEIAKSFNVYLFCVFVTIIGICFFIPELFYFLIGEEFYESRSLIPVLCFAVILSSIVVFAPGMAIAKKTKHIAIINIIGMLINIVLNIVFIKFFGLIGAAVATVISLAIVELINFVISAKYYPIPYSYLKIAIGTVVMLASILLINFHQNIGGFSAKQFIIKIILYFVVGVLLFVIFNFKKINIQPDT